MILETFEQKKTIKESIEFNGIGLHSGLYASIKICPSLDDDGVIFRTQSGDIPAFACNVTDTSRGTTLACDNSKIMTVEHVLSSIYAFGIDSAIICCDSIEPPIMDGSSGIFSESIKNTGTLDLDFKKKYYMPSDPIMVSDGDAFILGLPSNEFSVDYFLNYPHPLIGSQSYSYSGDLNDYLNNICSSRTFALASEIKFLIDNNLAKGGSLDNCIIIYDDHFSVDLRHDKELVTHKILDIIGDISLCGVPLKMKIISYKSGHKLNNVFANKLLDYIKNCK